MAKIYWFISRDWDKMRTTADTYEDNAESCRLDGKTDEAKMV